MTADGSLRVDAGKDYADAIAQVMFCAVPRSTDYAWSFKETGYKIPEPGLCYVADSDWLRDAHDLAKAIGKRIRKFPDPNHSGGIYRLVDDDPEERRLALEFAVLMGRADVDALLGEMDSAQWAEWQVWLKCRRFLGLLEPAGSGAEQYRSKVDTPITVAIDLRRIAREVVEEAFRKFADGLGE